MFLWRRVFGRSVMSAPSDDVSVRNSQLRKHAKRGDVHEFEEALVNIGESVNFVLDNHGKTALHYAVRYGKMNLVRWLVKEGADVNKRDSKNQVPLHTVYPDRTHNSVDCIYREWTESVRNPIVCLLLNNGADPNIQDNLGNTPAHIAVAQTSLSILTPLAESGADLTLYNGRGQTPFHLALLNDTIDWMFNLYGDLDSQDCHGDTLLHKLMRPEPEHCIPLISHHHLVLVQMVLEMGVSVDIANNAGITPYAANVMHLSNFNKLINAYELDDISKMTMCQFIVKIALVKHIIKLKTAGFPVREDISEETNDNNRYMVELQELQKLCQEELKKMADIPVHKSVNLRCVLSWPLRKSFHLRDRTMVERLESQLDDLDVDSIFPIYSNILEQTFEKLKKRHDLKTTAFGSLLDEKRPQTFRLLTQDLDAVDYLFDYLSNEDLENLSESV